MAKAEVSGTVTAFRQSKFNQDSHQTIVDLAKPEHAAELLGARVVWARKDGLQILGRVVALHGSKGELRVRWDRGFQTQALGSQVTMLPWWQAKRVSRARRGSADGVYPTSTTR